MSDQINNNIPNPRDYPNDEYHNPEIIKLRQYPTAIEQENGYFTNRDGLINYYRVWIHPERLKMKEPPRNYQGDAGTLIIHVHGFSSHCELSLPMADNLVDTDTVVASFDLTGHGYSEGLRGDYKRFMMFVENLEDFIIFMMKKYNDYALILSGESMGGLIVALFMILKYRREIYPVKKLLLWAPAFEPNFKFGWGKDLGFALKFGINFLVGPDKRSLPVDHSRTFQNPVALEIHNRDPRVLKKYSPRYMWNIYNAMTKLKQFGFSKKITVPFLIVHGTNDMLVSQPASERFYLESPLMNDCKYFKIRDCWHHIYTDPNFTGDHWVEIRQFLEYY